MVRYTLPGISFDGDKGLSSLCRWDYNLFTCDADPILDDTFNDLNPWRNVGGPTVPTEAFTRIDAPECSSMSALSRPGICFSQ